MEVLIENYTITRPVLIANVVKIDVEEIILNQSVTLRVTFARDDIEGRTFLYSDTLKLNKPQYDNWRDDNYLKNLIISQYSLIPK